MPRELKNLVLEEVSAVDQPANPGARVVLMKRGGIMNVKDFLAKVAKAAGLPDKEVEALVTETTKETGSMPEGNTDEIKALKAQLTRLEKRAAVSEAINKAADAKALDAIAADVTKAKEAKEMTDEDEKDFLERMRDKKKSFETADVTKAQTEFAAKLPEGLRKAFGELSDTDKDAFMKSYTAPKADDPVAKAMAELTKRNEALEKTVAELQKAAETAEAKELLKDLAGVVKVDDFLPTYLTLKKQSPEQAEDLVKQLRAAKAQAETAGLFKALGSDGPGNADSAEAKLEKAAEAVRKADPKLTKEAAFAKAIEDNPALYAEYNAEQEA